MAGNLGFAYAASAAIRGLSLASGSRPKPAFMFSRRCATLEVAGIAHVIDGCETMNFSST